jgi:hypothetical protein
MILFSQSRDATDFEIEAKPAVFLRRAAQIAPNARIVSSNRVSATSEYAIGAETHRSRDAGHR